MIGSAAWKSSRDRFIFYKLLHFSGAARGPGAARAGQREVRTRAHVPAKTSASDVLRSRGLGSSGATSAWTNPGTGARQAGGLGSWTLADVGTSVPQEQAAGVTGQWRKCQATGASLRPLPWGRRETVLTTASSPRPSQRRPSPIALSQASPSASSALASFGERRRALLSEGQRQPSFLETGEFHERRPRRGVAGETPGGTEACGINRTSGAGCVLRGRGCRASDATAGRCRRLLSASPAPCWPPRGVRKGAVWSVRTGRCHSECAGPG